MPIAIRVFSRNALARAAQIPRQHSPLLRILLINLCFNIFSVRRFQRLNFPPTVIIMRAGGPVSKGAALSCYMDGRPCCWANLPPPDDQLDWQIATGKPDTPYFQNAPAPEGSYLIAYARGAAPSDEAQFASCSIACASSPITVRAKHWQSENVLLQVCQRESFPNTVNFNPLLNCQEFPMVTGMGTTELVLPKASLVDIIFVASNFVGENGDIAILDDIEISYDSDGLECQKEENGAEAAQRLTVETNSGGKIARISEKSLTQAEKDLAGRKEKIQKRLNMKIEEEVENERVEEHEEHPDDRVVESVRKALGEQTVLASGSEAFSKDICENTKCDFEDGTTCHYKDAHQTQSIRGLTTKFQVVSGQFMNRVTGVKESIEGQFYAATFLFPREMAGLEVKNAPFTENSRMRFHYYEGTHGVQLKGCCDSLDSCPFQSDKFVTVNDRIWKTASLKCPKGTEKVIFVCENTRTNQGACAIDEIRMVETSGKIADVQPLC
ncbi:unnamed protein product, partial [Mesorhabditis belari]|uniref:Ig-like domain-containing protein n=1 Tax=Mesorhabditis belari TaxID=2138241 RepID=A0AAF3JBQ4_9BILA